MSEMLGNRYFIARQFDKAIPQFEDAIKKIENGFKIKKKLIICYIETGSIEKAFSLFYELVKIDPNIIIDTDPYYDDCPCGELIPSWEAKLHLSQESQGFFEVLGMLSLYCDLNKSINYFNRALANSKHTSIISSIIKKLNEFNLIHTQDVH